MAGFFKEGLTSHCEELCFIGSTILSQDGFSSGGISPKIKEFVTHHSGPRTIVAETVQLWGAVEGTVGYIQYMGKFVQCGVVAVDSGIVKSQ